MGNKKKSEEVSADKALSQQVDQENSVLGGEKIEIGGLDSEKTDKKINDNKKEENTYNTKLILGIIAAVFIILIIAGGIAAVFLLKNNSELKKDANIKKATVNGDIVNITLIDNINFTRVNSLEFVFSDKKNNKYSYNATTISSNYLINASSMGITNFDNIISVNAFFSLKGDVPAPIINNTNTTNPTCTDTCGILGKECGTWNICSSSTVCGTCAARHSCNTTGQCVVSCTDDPGCSDIGSYCQGNRSYNCTLGNDGCYDRQNLTLCGTTSYCFQGTCVAINTTNVTECSLNSSCFNNTNLTKICSIGFCNSTGRCSAIFNASSHICRSNLSECEYSSNCSGNSGTCPDNMNKSDGTVCSNGFCNQGKCINCTSDSNCNPDKCYGKDFRDYFCNSTNSCIYTVITKEENRTNGNCEDDFDNDCDNIYDEAEEKCQGCGNNKIEGLEVCDGTDLGKTSCETLEFTGGTLLCLDNCTAFDTTQCTSSVSNLSPLARFWNWLFGN